MRIIISILLNALSLYIGDLLLDGVNLNGITSALIAGAVLGLVNVTIKPILKLLSLPLTIITLGIFLLVINALMILLADYFVGGFSTSGFGSAFMLGIVIGILNLIYEMFSLNKKRDH